MDEFGALVRATRLERGWTQAELGERTQFGTPYISKIERGKERPPASTAVRLGEVLGFSWERALRAAGYCVHCGGTGNDLGEF